MGFSRTGSGYAKRGAFDGVGRREGRRIDKLIEDAQRHRFEGVGKPEPLQHGLAGYWSRRINDDHRMVYKAIAEALLIAQLRYHY